MAEVKPAVHIKRLVEAAITDDRELVILEFERESGEAHRLVLNSSTLNEIISNLLRTQNDLSRDELDRAPQKGELFARTMMRVAGFQTAVSGGPNNSGVYRVFMLNLPGGGAYSFYWSPGLDRMIRQHLEDNPLPEDGSGLPKLH